MLELLSKHDAIQVKARIQNKLNDSYPKGLAKSIFQYFMMQDGEVAGHGINKATTGKCRAPGSSHFV